jgi:putative serine protease PepD
MSEGPWPPGAGSSAAQAPGWTVPPWTAPGSAAAAAAAAGPAAAGPAGEHADAAVPAYPVDDPADLDYSLVPGRPAARRRWTLDHRGRRLVLAGLSIAVVSALVGGLLGGYIATRSQGTGTVPGYSLGSAPSAVIHRPATSIAGIAARVLPSVVMIRVNGGSGTGSGFVIHGGYIITNNHVVTLDGNASNASLQVVFNNGLTVPARLVGRDTYSDIAVIKPVGTRIRGLRPLPLGNSAGLVVGDPVVAFGAPLGLAGTVTNGIVSALDRPVQPGAGNGPAAPQVFLDAIQTDAPINPGNSGGPLVNRQGRVIGVNAAFDTLGGSMITGQGGSIGLGFAIPINEVARVATELIRTGHATHAVIGAALNLKYGGAGAQLAAQPVRGGNTRASLPVTPGGPADRAGLRAGDVIVSFAGQPVSSAQTLRAPGTDVRFLYLAHGRTYAGRLLLGAARS